MRILNIGKESATITISSVEVLALSNSMNEALEAVDDFEFQTRLGVTRDEVKKRLQDFISKLPYPSH